MFIGRNIIMIYYLNSCLRHESLYFIGNALRPYSGDEHEFRALQFPNKFCLVISYPYPYTPIQTIATLIAGSQIATLFRCVAVITIIVHEIEHLCFHIMRERLTLRVHE